jgi:hypothetical protein
VYTAPDEALFLRDINIGKGAMNKFGICFQKRNELFIIIIVLLSSIGRGSIKVPSL